MGFTTGVQAVQKIVEESKQRSGGGERQFNSPVRHLNYINWKPGEKKIVRFLSDAIVTGEFYDFIIDKTGSPKSFLVDPDDPHRLDRYRSSVPGVGWQRTFDGQIREPLTTTKSIGIAVLRHEPRNTEGKLVVKDVIDEKSVDGKTYQARHFGVISQLVSNFWHTLGTTVHHRYGTICDRDYEITRSTATGRDTKYDVIPLDPDPTLADPETVKKVYSYGYIWDDSDPERFMKCPMTAVQYAEYFASEDRYRLWLGGDGVTQSSGLDEFHPSTTHNPDEAQVSMPSGSNFTSLRDELMHKNK